MKKNIQILALFASTPPRTWRSSTSLAVNFENFGGIQGGGGVVVCK